MNKSRIKWINDKIDKGINIATAIACILTVLMTLTVLVEVFSRYIFSFPITWSAELTSILFPWIVFLTAISVAKKGGNVAITLLTDSLPPKWKKINILIIKFIILYFSVYMVIASYQLCVVTANINMPVLRFITKPYLYVSATVAFIGIGIITTVEILEIIFSKNVEVERKVEL